MKTSNDTIGNRTRDFPACSASAYPKRLCSHTKYIASIIIYKQVNYVIMKQIWWKFVRISRLNWIGHVNRMDIKRKVSQVFHNNPQGSRLRERPKSRCWKCVQTDSNRFKIKNWKVRSKSRADWEKAIKEAKVRVGL